MAVGEGTGTPRRPPRSHPWTANTVAARRVAVLLVDRGPALDVLAAELSAASLVVQKTADTADALLMVGRCAPDVVVSGPDGGRLDVVTLVEALRRNEPGLPVIVGVRPGDGELAAGLAALEPSAVVGYPFQTAYLAPLLASLAPQGRMATSGSWPIDLGRLQIEGPVPEIVLDGERAVLPLREFLLLKFLAEHAGRVVSHAEIGEAVWGRAEAGTTNTVAVHVLRLRRRLGGRKEGTQWITAVRGIGYQLTVPPM